MTRTELYGPNRIKPVLLLINLSLQKKKEKGMKKRRKKTLKALKQKSEKQLDASIK